MSGGNPATVAVYNAASAAFHCDAGRPGCRGCVVIVARGREDGHVKRPGTAHPSNQLLWLRRRCGLWRLKEKFFGRDFSRIVRLRTDTVCSVAGRTNDVPRFRHAGRQMHQGPVPRHVCGVLAAVSKARGHGGCFHKSGGSQHCLEWREVLLTPPGGSRKEWSSDQREVLCITQKTPRCGCIGQPV